MYYFETNQKSLEINRNAFQQLYKINIYIRFLPKQTIYKYILLQNYLFKNVLIRYLDYFVDNLN